MDKFQDTYCISSHRLHGWDYSQNGIYFITIVIQSREYILGQIENQKLALSDFSKIVNVEWFKSFKIRNELFLDEFIIMPNHLHALVILKNPNSMVDKNDNGGGVDCGDVETHGRASLPSQNDGKSTFQRKPKSISSFIAGFKSATIKQIDNYIDENELSLPKYNSQNKLWQSNYYDHIIRNEEEYWRIKKYIRNNPANWDNDKFNEI